MSWDTMLLSFCFITKGEINLSYNKEPGMYEGYIYLITNKINNKKYIGQTTRTIKIRISDHFSNLYKNYAITNAIKKYGKENF